jgi:glycosyltransferase involved in cell wall biosynthesis
VAHLTDIALISLATTPGLIASDAAFAELVRGAGATCAIVPVAIGPSGRLRRHAAVTDAVEAIAARRSAQGIEARAVVYSTITAALLQPDSSTPSAIRFDATAALNRPGLAGAWQRRREQRVLREADLLLPVSDGATAALPRGHAPVVRVPIPVPELAAPAERDIAATMYAAYPRKRGLELALAAWAEAGDGTLVVGGADREKGVRWLERCGVPEPPNVEWAGLLPRDEWLATVARSRVFVNASRWEDYGIAQFEALASGTPVVTVPSEGAYEALPILRRLAPELVAREISARALVEPLRAALTLDRAAYAERARDALRPYRADAIRQVVAERVLPALGIRP